MYTTRIVDANEKDKFNHFIAVHPKGHFLQLWEWGEVKRGMGWEPLPLVLEEDGSIKAAMLILKRRLPLPLLKKSIFYAPRGPVVDIDSEELCRVLVSGTRKVANKHGAIFLKIDPDIEKNHQCFSGILQNCGFRKNETGLNFEGVQPGFVFRLDISPSEIKLLENMHTKWRYNIRLAKKKGVIVRQAHSKDELRTFYTILQETAQRDHFLIRGYEYFEWIWEQMVANGHAEIFMAEHEGEVIAATLAFKVGDKAWYLYGASANIHRNLMPNYLLQWEMIRWARERGCKIYDFRGVSGELDESNPLYGLYRFKKGFNGVLTEFIGEWDLVFSPWFYWMWKRFLPVYQARGRGAVNAGQQEA